MSLALNHFLKAGTDWILTKFKFEKTLLSIFQIAFLLTSGPEDWAHTSNNTKFMNCIKSSRAKHYKEKSESKMFFAQQSRLSLMCVFRDHIVCPFLPSFIAFYLNCFFANLHSFSFIRFWRRDLLFLLSIIIYSV